MIRRFGIVAVLALVAGLSGCQYVPGFDQPATPADTHAAVDDTAAAVTEAVVGAAAIAHEAVDSVPDAPPTPTDLITTLTQTVGAYLPFPWNLLAVGGGAWWMARRQALKAVAKKAPPTG